jgi:hypothetical protein
MRGLGGYIGERAQALKLESLIYPVLFFGLVERYILCTLFMAVEIFVSIYMNMYIR